LVNKLFSLPSLAISILVAPLWPAVTKAFHEQNKTWILETYNKIIKVLIISSVIIIITMVFAKPIIKIWTLSSVEISYSLIIVSGIAVILQNFSSVHSAILFGIEVPLNFVILTIFQAIINIIVSLVAITYFNLGTTGVMLGTCFSMLTNVFYLPKLLKRIINKMK
jgi:O-antigen/teichoic acid export membrane protein